MGAHFKGNDRRTHLLSNYVVDVEQKLLTYTRYIVYGYKLELGTREVPFKDRDKIDGLIGHGRLPKRQRIRVIRWEIFFHFQLLSSSGWKISFLFFKDKNLSRFTISRLNARVDSFIFMSVRLKRDICTCLPTHIHTYKLSVCMCIFSHTCV